MPDPNFPYKAAITRLDPSTRDVREGLAPYRPSRLWRDAPDRGVESLPVSAEKLAKFNGRPRSPRLARVVEVEISAIQMLVRDLKLRVAALEQRMAEVVEIPSRLGTSAPTVKLMEEGRELQEPELQDEEELPDD